MTLGIEETADGIVVDCPVCKRTIWNGTRCFHGSPPPPGVGGPYVDKDEEPRVMGEYRTKTRDTKKRYGS